MNSTNKNNLKLGIFVVSGLLIFVLSIYYLGKKQNLFQSNIRVYTEFQDVKGLEIGNNIRFMGINVGTVMDISILNDSSVLVEMGIEKQLGRFIRKDARVEIDNEGIMGSKLITIYAGSNKTDLIKKDDMLQSFTSISYEDILNKLEKTATQTGIAAQNLVEVADKINNGTGDLAKFINDDNLSRTLNELSLEFTKVTGEAKEILKKANKGDNDLATLLNKNTLTKKLNSTLSNADSVTLNLKTASNELLIATEKINQGDGIIQKLLYDSTLSSNIDTAVYNINNSIDIVTETAESIRNSWIINVFSGKKRIKKKKK